MDRDLLAEADRVVASLPPARRELVREVVINVLHRGVLDDRTRRSLDSASGGRFLGDVLAAALDERDGIASERSLK